MLSLEQLAGLLEWATRCGGGKGARILHRRCPFCLQLAPWRLWRTRHRIFRPIHGTAPERVLLRLQDPAPLNGQAFAGCRAQKLLTSGRNRHFQTLRWSMNRHNGPSCCRSSANWQPQESLCPWKPIVPRVALACSRSRRSGDQSDGQGRKRPTFFGWRRIISGSRDYCYVQGTQCSGSGRF